MFHIAQMEKRVEQAAAATRSQPRMLIKTSTPRGSTTAFPAEPSAELQPAPLAVAFAFAPLEKKGAHQRFALARGN